MTNLSSDLDYYMRYDNSTITPVLIGIRWTEVPVLVLIIAILTFLLNGFLLSAFLKYHSRRTPFDIYVMHLLLSNVLLALFDYPICVLVYLYKGQWIFGDNLCLLHLFLFSVFNAACVNTHAIIAVNRTWAIIHPVSYRTRQTVRQSCITCVGMWIFIVLVSGGYVVLFYLSDADKSVHKRGCDISLAAIPVYIGFICIVLFLVPIIVIFLSFPVATFSRFFISRSVPVSRSHSAAGKRRNLKPSNSSTRTLMRCSNRDKGQQQHVLAKYSLLALMTGSVAVCYAPPMAFFIFSTQHPDRVFSPWISRIIAVLYPCQSLLDPILLWLSVKKLRLAVIQFFGTRNGSYDL